PTRPGVSERCASASALNGASATSPSSPAAPPTRTPGFVPQRREHWLRSVPPRAKRASAGCFATRRKTFAAPRANPWLCSRTGCHNLILQDDVQILHLSLDSSSSRRRGSVHGCV